MLKIAKGIAQGCETSLKNNPKIHKIPSPGEVKRGST